MSDPLEQERTMELSEQLQYWANHSNISEQGKKDHAAMAKDAEALEARLSKMEGQIELAQNAVDRADAQVGALIDQTVIYSGAWDELQEALAGEKKT